MASSVWVDLHVRAAHGKGAAGHPLVADVVQNVPQARWRGNCLVRLGDSTAVEHSIAALAAMDVTFTRAEASLRCDLAEAMLMTDERNEAITHAQRARELALRVGSVRQHRRIRRLAERLFRWMPDSNPG